MLGFGRLGARLFGTRSDRAEAKRETRRVKGAEPGLVAPGVGDAFVPSAGVEPASERALRAGVEPASERALRAGVDAGLELGARAADGAAIDPPGP
ncbi:hypothetical protein L6R52_38475, partial [Myxococcota bacterium]|nr:hypothetical protein [Myxococcota bacterium]